jgi:hypothetical protein
MDCQFSLDGDLIFACCGLSGAADSFNLFQQMPFQLWQEKDFQFWKGQPEPVNFGFEKV